LQNNNVSLEDEVSSRDSEISQLREEQDEILEEMERLREENDRLNLHTPRSFKPRVYEVGIQCESRMCEKACQTRNPHYTPASRSRLPRPVSQLNGSMSNIRRACSVGNISSRAESPVRGVQNPHGGSTRDISSRIPVGRHHDSQNLPNRYEREYGSGYPQYASTPGGLNHPGGYPNPSRRGYMNRGSSMPGHYQSSPGLSQNRQVRFRQSRENNGRSLVDLRDIEASIQDIGVSLRDIKSISRSMKDVRAQQDDEAIEV